MTQTNVDFDHYLLGFSQCQCNPQPTLYDWRGHWLSDLWIVCRGTN
jgi:hypothetical protein